jgi:hypothetical protein
MAAQRQRQDIPLQILTIIDAPATARLVSNRARVAPTLGLRIIVAIGTLG